MLDAVYSPQPIESKPEWFNGFIRLEKHRKEKYNWYRYVYLPDYYTTECSGNTSDVESRFGILSPSQEGCEFIPKYFHSYYNNGSTEYFDLGNRKSLGGRSIGNAIILNSDTDQETQQRYFYTNGEYVVRQLNGYDRQDVKDMTKICAKELEEFILYETISELLEEGLIVAPFDSNGKIKGIQTYKVTKNYAAPEPMGIVNADARGQGIFTLYHDYSVELGEAVGVEYLYAQTDVKNEKTASIYESYGYVRNKKLKKSKHKSYITLQYPLKTKQQSFF